MSSRSQEIATVIGRAILAARLVPGTKLGERELSECLGASRIVIRQALIRLAEEGLVDIERNRGAFVARPSLQEALEIYDAVTILEQGAMAQLVNRFSTASRSELRRHLERQKHAVAAKNEGLSDELGAEFHTLLVRLSHNRVIVDLHAQLMRRVRLLRSLYRAEFDYCTLLEDHERILDLLERGKLRQAQDLLDSHHKLVVRGYVLQDKRLSAMPVAEALRPFIAGDATAREPKGDPGRPIDKTARPGAAHTPATEAMEIAQT